MYPITLNCPLSTRMKSAISSFRSVGWGETLPRKSGTGQVSFSLALTNIEALMATNALSRPSGHIFTLTEARVITTQIELRQGEEFTFQFFRYHGVVHLDGGNGNLHRIGD